MAINPYQSVLPGTEGNPIIPKINQYQNILPGTTGNVYNPTNMPIPETKTISTDIIGTQPVKFPQAPTPEVPVMPSPIQRVDEGTTQINANGTTATTGATPPIPTPTASTEAETTQTCLMSRFQTLSEKLFGKQQVQAQAEQAQGIPQKVQVFNDIQSQINQLQNEANAAVIKAQTVGETTSFGNAQIAQIERDRTVKALGLNSLLYAAQGNLATAQMMADKAVAAEFGSAEAEIGYIRDFLDMNEKVLSREDKKKADALKIQLDERTRIIEEKKAEKKAINSIAIEAAQAGADASLLNKIQNATSQQEALRIASSDPMLFQWAAQKQREQVELDLQLKREQIAKIQKEGKGADLNEVLSVAEAKSLGVPYGTTKGQAMLKAGLGQGTEFQKAEAKGNIDLIEGIAKHTYLDTAVGPSKITRFSLTDVFTGGKSDFIAGVEQLRSQLTLDSLIQAKDRGATFGALSDSELKILSSSASKLGTWAITKDGNVVVYKASEKSFKDEINKISNFAKLDYILKGGDPIEVGAQVMTDNTIWVQNYDGTLTQLK